MNTFSVLSQRLAPLLPWKRFGFPLPPFSSKPPRHPRSFCSESPASVVDDAQSAVMKVLNVAEKNDAAKNIAKIMCGNPQTRRGKCTSVFWFFVFLPVLFLSVSFTCRHCFVPSLASQDFPSSTWSTSIITRFWVTTMFKWSWLRCRVISSIWNLPVLIGAGASAALWRFLTPRFSRIVRIITKT